MLRRVHVEPLRVGEIDLPEAQAHHLRAVLRLGAGDAVELFDAEGRTARGMLTVVSPKTVTVRVGSVVEPSKSITVTVASVVPKGERADWMIEKLSELGVARFIPLQTERSVVHPEGKSKFERWARIAAESAKQSRRAGVMRIDPLTPLRSLIDDVSRNSFYLSTAPDAPALISNLQSEVSDLTLFIGPEGGWTDAETALFASKQIQPAHLTQTVLRIETAAVTAAAVALCVISNNAPHL
jgi:16S rRNA (uracil1498-N3)-methyltransferase